MDCPGVGPAAMLSYYAVRRLVETVVPQLDRKAFWDAVIADIGTQTGGPRDEVASWIRDTTIKDIGK